MADSCCCVEDINLGGRRLVAEPYIHQSRSFRSFLSGCCEEGEGEAVDEIPPAPTRRLVGRRGDVNISTGSIVAAALCCVCSARWQSRITKMAPILTI